MMPDVKSQFFPKILVRGSPNFDYLSKMLHQKVASSSVGVFKIQIRLKMIPEKWKCSLKWCTELILNYQWVHQQIILRIWDHGPIEFFQLVKMVFRNGSYPSSHPCRIQTIGAIAFKYGLKWCSGLLLYNWWVWWVHQGFFSKRWCQGPVEFW